MNYQKATLDRKMTGSNIRSLIAESMFTYEEIAFILELSSSRVIYEWVSGNKIPSTENIANLAKIFNVKMENIVSLR
ncbi:MAG: helix-turn-helix transcriptional regulator [Bacilli bacterium]